MADTTEKAEKDRRFQQLVDTQNVISKEIHSQYIGRTMRVLVDGHAEHQPGCLSARTNGGRLVVLPGSDSLIGSFVNAEITGATTWSLSGRLV